MNGSRPASVFDPGLQHERTALAWERTAIASMVAGVLMARYAAAAIHVAVAAVGVAQVVFGAVLLVWSARHYDDLPPSASARSCSPERVSCSPRSLP